MAPRHNPRRNVGAPLRLEDDESYLSGRPRDPTKPAWPQMLADSIVPYNSGLAPVAWNSNKNITSDHEESDTVFNPDTTGKMQDFNITPMFEEPRDFDMSSSESEHERSDDECQNAQHAIDDPAEVITTPTWGALDLALQLSIYQTVYESHLLHNDDKATEARTPRKAQSKAARLLGLSKDQVSDIEQQRVFRIANPASEDEIRAKLLAHEMEAMRADNYLVQETSQIRAQREETTERYLAHLAQIARYKYTNERAIRRAEAYLEAHGLAPGVVGIYTAGDTETTMQFVSITPADPKSLMLYDAFEWRRVPATVRQFPGATTRAPDTSTEQSAAAIEQQPCTEPQSAPRTVEGFQDFVKNHDPECVPSKVVKVSQRGGLGTNASNLCLKINLKGTAKVHATGSKRRSRSDFQKGHSREPAKGKRLVVLVNGHVGFDIDDEPTPEVESLLQTGFEARKRLTATHPTRRLQGVPAEHRPVLFTDRLLGIDSNHMPSANAGSLAMDGQGEQPLVPEPKTPQPSQSPMGIEDTQGGPSPGPQQRQGTATSKNSISSSADAGILFPPAGAIPAHPTSQRIQGWDHVALPPVHNSAAQNLDNAFLVSLSNGLTPRQESQMFQNQNSSYLASEPTLPAQGLNSGHAAPFPGYLAAQPESQRFPSRNQGDSPWQAGFHLQGPVAENFGASHGPSTSQQCQRMWFAQNQAFNIPPHGLSSFPLGAGYSGQPLAYPTAPPRSQPVCSPGEIMLPSPSTVRTPSFGTAASELSPHPIILSNSPHGDAASSLDPSSKPAAPYAQGSSPFRGHLQGGLQMPCIATQGTNRPFQMNVPVIMNSHVNLNMAVNMGSQLQQLGSSPVASRRRTGKGSRGGPGAYKKKAKPLVTP